MKSIAIIAIALACVLGLATAQYGYYPAAQQSGGFGNGGFLYLIGLLVILFALFGFNNTDNGNTNIIFGNFSGVKK